MMRLSFGGPVHTVTDRTGKKWRLEAHPYCGPVALDKHGELLETQPAESSPFWDAVAGHNAEIKGGGTPSV